MMSTEPTRKRQDPADEDPADANASSSSQGDPSAAGTAASKNDDGSSNKRLKRQEQPSDGTEATSTTTAVASLDSTSSTTTKRGRRRKKLSSDPRCRRTNDEIHSTIEWDPVTNAVVDTPPLQRTRDLKQLGPDQVVYVNVNHSRFEHSLGVAFLASKLCRGVQQRQPQLGVTDKDVLCVNLAGLMHDTGHGPFSHTFEDFIMNSLPEYLEDHPELKKCYEGLPEMPGGSSDYTHEHMSLRCVDAALEHHGLAIDLDNLDAPLKEIEGGTAGIDATSFGVRGCESSGDEILTSRDFVFIKECIWGKPVPEIEKKLGRDGFHGRGRDKQWMYDIVCNSHSGLDVDKIDYFARDERRAMRAAGEVDKVMVDEAVVAWGCCDKPGCQREKRRMSGKDTNQHLMICYPEKMVGASLGFFRKRFELFTKVYKHKTCTAASFMIRDIFCYADAYLRLPALSSNSQFDFLPISRATLDMSTFLNLDDYIIQHISWTTDPKLGKARSLIKRFRSHNLYKCVFKKRINTSNDRDTQLWELSKEEIKGRIMEYAATNNPNAVQFQLDDLIVEKCDVHYGSKDMNPVDRMRFVRESRDSKSLSKTKSKSRKSKSPKSDLENLNQPIDKLPVAVKVDESEYDAESYAELPRSFRAKSLRIFSRNPNFTRRDVIREQWLLLSPTNNNDIPNVSQDTDVEGPDDDDDDDDDDDGEADSDYCDDNSSPATKVTPTRPRRKLSD